MANGGRRTLAGGAVALLVAAGGVMAATGCSSEQPVTAPEAVDADATDGLQCEDVVGVSIDVPEDAVGAASPGAALEALPDRLESTGIALPDVADLVGTGFSSSDDARFTLADDGRAVATVELHDRGSGWFVTDVVACRD